MTVQLADAADEEFEDVSTEIIELGPEASTGLRASMRRSLRTRRRLTCVRSMCTTRRPSARRQ